ncbi:MAG TPA: HNH endonuclease signature motif containing protein [Phenylobacterium sp.]
MKGHPITYSAEELAWIEERKEWPRAALHSAFVALFDRDDVSLGTLNGLCKRKGWMTGRDGKIGKGAEPWNKGLHYSPPGSERTRFKKGNKPHNTRWAGHERVSKDGYVEISVEETNPYTGFERRYILKHVWCWEKANGPIPEGYCLKALDGDRSNTDPANWELIPRALLPALNGGRHKRRPAFDQADPTLKPALLTLAKVEAKVRDLRRGKSA